MHVSEAARSIRRPAHLAPVGLRIGGATQVFQWERPFQERFAHYVSRQATTIVNVGYGLGFAQRIFASKQLERLHLIEGNPFVMSLARRRAEEQGVCLHLGTWQSELPGLCTSTATIYFDAFPVSNAFRYTPIEFRAYIEPLLCLLESKRCQRSYFVAFDKQEIPFRTSKSVRVSRVLTFPLPQSGVDRRQVSRISLYQIKTA